MKYVCELCGYIYDENLGDTRNGIAPGTAFERIADDYECPGCGYKKEAFNPVIVLKGLKTQSHTRISVRR